MIGEIALERLVYYFFICLAGAAAGFMLPEAAQRISDYKNRKKGTDQPVSLLFISLPVKMTVSILNAILWLYSGFGTVLFLQAFALSLLFSLAILISIIDLRIRIVPNELVLAMCAAGVVFQLTFFGIRLLLSSVFIMLGMMILFTAVAGFVGFGKVGAGDVKLAGVMGFSLGYPSILTALAAMSAALLIYSLGGLITRKLTLKSAFPFAPFMMLGLAVSLLRIVFTG
jgi:prepilin signal peptidase PulO-like enzyme (type II secretory pathway)